MVIHRAKFFLALFSLIIIPLLVNKIIWLARSQKAEGIFGFNSKGNALDQIPQSYSILFFKYGKDTIWFNGPGNLSFEEGAAIPIRYQTSNPSDVKLNTFLGIWGATAIWGGIPLLVLLVICAHPEIVPYSASLRLMRRKPFIVIIPKELPEEVSPFE